MDRPNLEVRTDVQVERVTFEGKRATAARVMAAYPEDEGLEVIRLDGLQRGNAE